MEAKMNLVSNITGKTKIICIIGNPVEHSISPMLHNTISRELDIDLVYVTFRVENGELENAVQGLKALNVLGYNVTVPYKKEIMKYLDENSQNALLVGAVNTVKFMDGRLYGYNTDADGFLRSFKEETGEGFTGKKVTVIGAGGASRAVSVKVAMDGAKDICIINRTKTKASEIAEVINNNIKNAAHFMSPDDKNAAEALKNSDVIINATSIGMYPETNEIPVKSTDVFNRNQVVCDIIYNPFQTRFLNAAKKSGARTMNGIGMLFYQGISSYEIWAGIKIGDEVLKKLKNAFIKPYNY
jgi:shikimate dehydrogenase